MTVSFSVTTSAQAEQWRSGRVGRRWVGESKNEMVSIGVVEPRPKSSGDRNLLLSIALFILWTSGYRVSPSLVVNRIDSATQMYRGVHEQELIDALLTPNRYDWRIRPLGNNSDEPSMLHIFSIDYLSNKFISSFPIPFRRWWPGVRGSKYLFTHD